MSRDDTRPGTFESRDDCSTTNSFGDHGIGDGETLIREAYRRLDGRSFSPTEEFFDSLTSAFTLAYLGEVDEPGVPPHVQAAIDDARLFTFDEFQDDPDADLRTRVIPAFYQRVAGFHCAYRD